MNLVAYLGGGRAVGVAGGAIRAGGGVMGAGGGVVGVVLAAGKRQLP